MKHSELFFLAALFIIFTGCEKIEDSIKIKVEETSTIVIPSGTMVNLPVNLPTPEQESSLEEELSINNSRKDKVKTIKLKELNMTITQPPGKNFSFLNSIVLYIKAEGLPEKEIGYLEMIPNNAGTSITLNVYDYDFTDYLKQEKFSLKANIKTDELLTSETSVEVYSRFEVTADLL